MSQDPTIGNDAKTGDGALPDGLNDLVITHDHLLGKTVSVMQPKSGFRVGTDAVLLAAAIGVNRGRILDMGAGVGGVSLCLARRLDAVQITAIEIDPVMAALAQRNVAANGFDDRLRILRDDITKMPPVLAGSFDHIVSNPPYHHATGTRPRDKRRALAHIGEGLALGDWVKSAMWAAKLRGRISFICRADRADELIHLFTKVGASEILQFPLWPRPMVPAGRVIIQVRKAVSGPGAILPGLIMHNDDGSFTEAASRIMNGEGLYMVHPARRV
ncbi:methyltransferase [Alphaproteobacteria bacterium]|nr:methyltransferase [Alphaproteobacteria bacterium]